MRHGGAVFQLTLEKLLYSLELCYIPGKVKEAMTDNTMGQTLPAPPKSKISLTGEDQI